MANIDSLNRAASASASKTSSPSSVAASSELAKLESQLSDWVNCASSKTSAGKAKIEDITGKIDTIKSQVKAADDRKVNELPRAEAQQPSNTAVGNLRFDGLGTLLNEQA